MAKSLGKRFEDQGISKEYIREAIKQRGILPVVEELGCSIEAFQRYVVNELGIKDAQLLNVIYSKNPKEIARVILESYTDLFKSLKAEIQRLHEEIQARDQKENKRDATLKASLCEMLAEVKASGSIPDAILKNLEMAIEPAVREIKPRQEPKPAKPEPAAKKDEDILKQAEAILNNCETDEPSPGRPATPKQTFAEVSPDDIDGRLDRAFNNLWNEYLKACDNENWALALAMFQWIFEYDLIMDERDSPDYIQSVEEWISKAENPDELIIEWISKGDSFQHKPSMV